MRQDTALSSSLEFLYLDLSMLGVLMLFFGLGIFAYLRPCAGSCQNADQLLALFYTVITPMLNPFVYTLRNQEVTGAMRRLLKRYLWSLESLKFLDTGTWSLDSFKEKREAGTYSPQGSGLGSVWWVWDSLACLAQGLKALTYCSEISSRASSYGLELICL